MNLTKQQVSGAILGAVIIIGGSFYGGYAYGKTGAASAIAVRGGQFAQIRVGSGQRGGNAFMGGFLAGDIIGKDADSLTIRVQGGGSRIAFLATSTAIQKSAPGSLSDIQIGQSVMIMGSQNSDGSLVARSIQIRPAGTGTTTRMR
jgi:hypothetical protein